MPPVEEPQEPQILPETDIQAVLTVLGRRDETARKQDEAAGRHLTLRGTDLRGAHLFGAHFEGATLWGAHLERAVLANAHLEGAYLANAHLEGAYLVEAHLEGAFLVEAHLEGALLANAHLEGALLLEAHLEGASLKGAVGLTQEHLDMAFGDDNTVLPEGITRPARWPAATSDQQADKPE
jgi:uncharacterized protein YjbI with pentapeptide repeats